MSFKSNFERICAEKKTTPTAVCNSIGITASAYSQWSEKTVPRKNTILRLAMVLNVSPEVLLQEKSLSGQTEKADANVQRFISLTKNLSPEQVDNLLSLLESMTQDKK